MPLFLRLKVERVSKYIKSVWCSRAQGVRTPLRVRSNLHPELEVEFQFNWIWVILQSITAQNQRCESSYMDTICKSLTDLSRNQTAGLLCVLIVPQLRWYWVCCCVEEFINSKPRGHTCYQDRRTLTGMVGDVSPALCSAMVADSVDGFFHPALKPSVQNVSVGIHRHTTSLTSPCQYLSWSLAWSHYCDYHEVHPDISNAWTPVLCRWKKAVPKTCLMYSITEQKHPKMHISFFLTDRCIWQTLGDSFLMVSMSRNNEQSKV